MRHSIARARLILGAAWVVSGCATLCSYVPELGSNGEYERRQREQTDCDLEQLHRGAQRIAWGATMAGRIRADLD